MRALALALAGLGSLVAIGTGCRETPTPPSPAASGAPAASVPRAAGLTSGTFHFTPKNEDTRVGPVGTGNARCELYVYGWKAGDEACKLQLNHCELPANGDGLQCLSLADERTITCGRTADACGQTVACDCPTGDAEKVADAPGTIHVTPNAVGQAFASADKKCEAKVTKLGLEGPPPAPCVLGIHECPPGAACIDRTEMLSCGVRSSVCDHPVKCDCP